MKKSETRPPYGRRRASRAALAVGALVLGLGVVPPAGADDLEDRQGAVQSQLDASRARLASLSAKSQEAVLALEATKTGVAKAKNAVAAAQATEASAMSRKAAVDADLLAARNAEAEGLARIAQIQADQAKNNDLRDNIARQAYEGGSLERLAAVLNTDHARDLADNMYVVEKVNDSQNALLAELAAKKAQADAEQAKLVETRRRIAALQLEADAAVATAAQAKADAAASQAKLVALQGEQEKAAAAVAAQRGEEEARVKELAAESARIQAELAAIAARNRAQVSADADSWTVGNGRLSIPVPGPLTSPYGPRINPVLGTTELHTGIDIGAGCGTPVHASADGTILRAGVLGGYGNSIWIQHGGGIVTTYNHMSGFAKTGGQVTKGDIIGYVGTTGLSTGCHMHFEVRVGGAPVDPMGWL